MLIIHASPCFCRREQTLAREVRTADAEAHLEVHQIGAHSVVLLTWRTRVRGEMGRVHGALLKELAEHVARGTVGFLEGDRLGHEHVELDSLLAAAFAWRVGLRVL